MSFINIFNFKKYLSKPSDAQVARIGHVNALYDALTPPVQVIQVEAGSTLVTDAITVTKTSNKGIVEVSYTGPTINQTINLIIFRFEVTFSNISPTANIHIVSTLCTDYPAFGAEVARRFIHNVEAPFQNTNNVLVFGMTAALGQTSPNIITIEEGSKFKFMYEITEY